MPIKLERIQKVLANAGYGSRREIEQWIEEGRITVDGKVAQLGDKISNKVQLKLDGRAVHLAQEKIETRVLMLNKPEGVICTRNDPEGRPTIYDYLPPLRDGKWISIGRLDFNTSGLLLVTNDGGLANKLMHPSAGIEREYAVRVLGEVDDAMMRRLTQGVKLEDGIARFEHIVSSGGMGANRWYHVVVAEGRNRVVRRLWESQGCTVSRLKRVRFGPIILHSKLKQGRYEEVDSTILA